MRDLISRQAAIDAIEREKVKVFHELYDEAWNDAINGCKEVIEQLPPIQPVNNSEVPNSSDTISRQSAIDAVMECYDNDELFEVYEWKLNELPHIQPIQPKRGRWIYKTDLITAPTGYWECSECKEGRLLYEENFCPHCGADMRATE